MLLDLDRSDLLIPIDVGRLNSTGKSPGTIATSGNSWGTTPGTPALSGNSFSCECTITSGSGSPASGAALTVTFSKAFKSAPRVVVSGNIGVIVASTTTTFTITTTSAPAASTAYRFACLIIGA